MRSVAALLVLARSLGAAGAADTGRLEGCVRIGTVPVRRCWLMATARRRGRHLALEPGKR